MFNVLARGLQTLLLLAVTAGALLANASDAYRCHSIQNADDKQFCLATTRHESYRCHSVRNDDLRNRCLALIKGEPYRCHSIRDDDDRNA